MPGSVRWLMVLPLGVVLACADSPVPTGSAVPVARASGHTIADPDSDDWNTFDADVVVTFEMSLGGNSTRQSGALAYHLRRTKSRDGHWETDLLLADYAPRELNPVGYAAPNPPKRVARVIAGRGDGAPRLLDADGVEIQPAAPTFEEPKPLPGYAIRPVAPLPTLPAPRPPSGRRIAADTSRAWADHFFVTPAATARLRGRLEAGGERAPHGVGKSRYAQRRGAMEVEIIMDDATGRIIESRAIEHGRVRSTTELAYTEVEDGVAVLRSERISNFPPDAGESPRVMVVNYVNIRLSQER